MPQKPSDKTENPSAFKHWINKALFERMAESISGVYGKFDSRAFILQSKKIEPLELKQRVQFVSALLHEGLPKDFRHAVKILQKSLEAGKLDGFDLWPYTEFVQTYGLEDFDESMLALREFTKVFTSEFAVRPFLKRYPEKTLALLSKWATDESRHVRRWVSEGTRPRLPWGERLEIFVKQPQLTLPLLEKLKSDPEIYVRKSVANHLNDIAKDHPDLVVKVLKRWQAQAKNEDLAKFHWIRNHALRVLIKQGYEPALELIGINSKAKIGVRGLSLRQDRYRVNDLIEFEFKVVSLEKNEQKLVIDYVIHHVKSNKERTPKVFKLKNVILKPGEALRLKKKHSLKPITTRRYYPGKHLLEIQVNGKILAKREWVLEA
ncbi:MAG: DNA alkylation repair protein [Bdellovibrionota bacterium]